MAVSGEIEDLQINISYDLNGRDPKEVEKLVKKTLKELVKAGNIDANAYTILPQETAEDWELELVTGKEGCSCPVVVHVCGVKGDEKPIVLRRDMNGDTGFMPGGRNTFLISISDSIGDVFKLRFGFPDDVKEASWSLKSVKIFHPLDKDTFKDEVNFEIKKTPNLDPWQEIPVIWPDYPKLPIINYQVYTSTSIKSNRMDSGVAIILYGDYGNTGKRQLKKSLNSKVKFQPGQNDRFEVPAVRLGEVRRVWVGNDLSGTHKSWLLDKVVVKETPDSEREWLFKCRRFFAPDKGDHQTERILELGKELPPEPGEEERPPSPPKPPPPKPALLPPEPEPEPQPERQRKKEKTIIEEAPIEEKPKKRKAKKVEPPPPPESEPEPRANDTDWQIWWFNNDEQENYQGIEITFILVAEMGESSEIKLDKIKLDKGESKRYDFEMEPVDVGLLQKVRLRFGEDVKRKTRWDIARLYIKHLRSGSIHTFEFQKPIIKKDADTAMEGSSENIPLRTYVVTLFAGSRPGLTGNVQAYLIIRGEKGDTGRRWIVNHAEGKNSLQKGGVMKLEIDSVDLGQVMGIRLGHDIPGRSPAYFLEKVIVRPTHRADLQYVFTFEDDDPEEGEAAAAEEEQQGQKYDPKDWQMSWTNEPNQPRDFLQIAAILFGEKGQSTSYFIDVELRPGDSDGYLIRVEQDIGELIKVRMSNGPNVKGKHPWLIRELRLKHLLSGKIYTFQLGGAGGDTGMRKYKLELYYSARGLSMLPDVRFNVKIFGDKSTTERIALLEQRSPQQPQESQATMDSFDLDLLDLGEVNNLRLGHNKKNKQIGLFVQRVVLKPLHLPNKEWVFNIPYKEEEEKDVAQSEWLISWLCSESQPKVLTTAVFVLYAEDGRKTPEICTQTMLRPGQSEEIMYLMERPKLFKLYKVRVGFWEKQYDPIQWNLKLVRIRCVQTRSTYTFTLNGMVLFNDERDGWREIAIDVPPDQHRPPAVTYEVQVFTSKEVGVVTDSKIHVMINGKIGDTGKRKLLRSLNNGFKNFIPGRLDVFRLEAVDLDEITSIVVGHNNQGRYPSWHCERILITDRHGGQVYEFEVNKWFDKMRADRLIEREIPVARLQRAGLGRKWFIKVKVGDHPRAATKTSIAIFLCGTENTSDVVLLGKNMGVGEGFKPKGTYEFNVEVDLDDIEDVIGELLKIRLGFLDWNQWPSILIQEVFLEELATGAQYHVDVNEWIWSSPKHDGWREFQVRGPAQMLSICKYQLAVWTGNEQQANTDADVHCTIYGTKGDTGKRRLCYSKTHIKPFQHGQMDMFDIEAVELGDIKKVMVMMIPEEAKDNWHVLKLSLQQHPFNGEEFQFDCNRWFDSVQHTHMFTPNVRNEGKIYSGPPGEHLIFLTTGSQRDIPTTTASISLEVFGDRGKAGPFPLEPPPIFGLDGVLIPPDPKDRPFQPGAMDFFPFLINEEQIGRILKVRLTSDNKGRAPRWFLEKFAIQNLTKPRVDTMHFNVNDWLSDDRGDGELTREFATEHPAEAPLPAIRYRVEIGIGQKTTPAIPHDTDCVITLYGSTKFSSGPRRLRRNVDGHKLLQPGKTNVFYITAVGVGDIVRILVGHTCPDARFKFHVRDVTIGWEPNNKITFPCDELIVKTKPNVAAEISLGANNQK